MATNALGPGTRNITSNVPDEVYLQIAALARASGTNMAAYGRALFVHAASRRIMVRENRAERLAWEMAIKNGVKSPAKPAIEVVPDDEDYTALKVAETPVPPTRARRSRGSAP